MSNEFNKCYLLDTNMVSYFIKGVKTVCDKTISVPMSSLGISAITEGEIMFGLAKSTQSKQLSLSVHEFLIRVDILPWDSDAAKCYGVLRANMQKKGRILGNLDMLIAAHALALDRILVTGDKAFTQVKGLKIEDWTQ